MEVGHVGSHALRLERCCGTGLARARISSSESLMNLTDVYDWCCCSLLAGLQLLLRREGKV